jgi:PHD/YefM family antitoxin component YafN of YafNO toxin-antitoxin module
MRELLLVTRLAAGKARKDFASALSRVAYAKERIVLQRRGKDVAALVSIDDLALLEAIEDRLDLEDARAALEEAEERGTTRWEKIKADLGL